MKELHLLLNSLKHSSVRLNLKGWTVLILVFAPLISWTQLELTVIDQDQYPLVGVEVYNDDFSIATTTDLDGRVNLSKAQGPINFKYLGYEDLRISVADLKSKGSKVTMIAVDVLIEEILVIGRTEQTKESLPYEIKSIDQKELASTNPQTSADALSHHANVFVQKSQLGGGSPIIRGFEANKVLLVIDGIRLNNAIFRNGHLQNAITVDQAMLEQMDIIFGPNSLMYGSDALGGVIHFRSRLPKLNFDKSKSSIFEGNYYLRHSTANNEKTAHVDFNFGGDKIASLTSLTFSDFGDLKMGANRTERFPDFGKRFNFVETINGEDQLVQNDDPNLQVGTAYRQFDVLQKVLFQPNDSWQFVANLQYSTSSDVPRYDQLIEPDGEGLRFAEWFYGPQNRLLTSLSAKHLAPNSIYDKAIFIAAFQHIEEDRIDRRFGSNTRSHQEENVSVYSFTFDFTKATSTQSEILYGGDLNFNRVNSIAFEENITTNIQDFNVLTRYPSGGSTMNTFGAYAQFHWQSKDELQHLNTGVRYSRTELGFSYLADDPITWPSNFVSGINSNNNALTWSIGWTQHTKSNWHFRALASSAFRSPNIDDMAKIRVKSGEVTFPNADLIPEKSINGELSLNKDFIYSGNKKVDLGLTVFATQLNEAIIRLPFQDNQGNTTFSDEGETFAIVANQNAQSAEIYGYSTYLNADITNSLKFDGSISYTSGQVVEDNVENTPLAHIPPIYGKLGLKYKASDKWDAMFAYRFNAAKDIADFGGSADNPELATLEGALAYSTLNLYFNYEISKSFSVSIAGENLLDKHYRPFASGVSGAGRNAVVSLRGRF